MPSLVAVILHVPTLTAVTLPVVSTVATVLSDDDHVTVAPDLVEPSAFFTVAVRVSVPATLSVRLVFDTVTVTSAEGDTLGEGDGLSLGEADGVGSGLVLGSGLGSGLGDSAGSVLGSGLDSGSLLGSVVAGSP